MLRTRFGLTMVILLVFAANVVETDIENRLLPANAPVPADAYQFAHAMQKVESHLSIEKFENHDATSRWLIYGYSISYFFLFPLVCLGMAIALMRREEIDGYRVLALAVAYDYLISLGFFIFMPVPERWAFPDSGAILLSDLWWTTLIEYIRPISGLDNCFPSSHVSLMMVVILVGFLYQVRWRTTVLLVGISVMLATFVLGIHWVPDMIAGAIVGWMSVMLARRVSAARLHGRTATTSPVNLVPLTSRRVPALSAPPELAPQPSNQEAA